MRADGGPQSHYIDPMGEIDRLQLRVSDADREQVAETLRRAAGEGRLDYNELDERLGAAYQAKTYADLVPITVDLPGQINSPDGSTPVVRSAGDLIASEPQKHTAIFGGFERKGVWTVPTAMQIVAVMGGANLDLRQAEFAARTCELTIYAVMGGVGLIVPPDVRVIFSMTSVMGGHDDNKGNSTASPDAPTLVIKGFCLMGGVGVDRKPRTAVDGESRKELGS